MFLILNVTDGPENGKLESPPHSHDPDSIWDRLFRLVENGANSYFPPMGAPTTVSATGRLQSRCEMHDSDRCLAI